MIAVFIVNLLQGSRLSMPKNVKCHKGIVCSSPLQWSMSFADFFGKGMQSKCYFGNQNCVLGSA